MTETIVLGGGCFWGIELATAFTFAGGKLAKEILVDPAH